MSAQTCIQLFEQYIMSCCGGFILLFILLALIFHILYKVLVFIYLLIFLSLKQSDADFNALRSAYDLSFSFKAKSSFFSTALTGIKAIALCDLRSESIEKVYNV